MSTRNYNKCIAEEDCVRRLSGKSESLQNQERTYTTVTVTFRPSCPTDLWPH